MFWDNYALNYFMLYKDKLFHQRAMCVGISFELLFFIFLQIIWWWREWENFFQELEAGCQGVGRKSHWWRITGKKWGHYETSYKIV